MKKFTIICLLLLSKLTFSQSFAILDSAGIVNVTGTIVTIPISANTSYSTYFKIQNTTANNINYNLTGSYLNEKDKALFKSNDYTEDFDNQNYAFGNSFGVIYDDVRTFRFYGELKADFSQNVSFGINIVFQRIFTHRDIGGIFGCTEG